MMRIVLLHRALRLAMQSPLRPQARHLHSTVATRTTPTTSGIRHCTALLAGAATRPHRGSTALDCTVGTTTTSTVHGRAQIVFGRTWKTTMMMRGTALKRMSKAIAHSASPKCIVVAKHRIAPAAPHGPTHALQAAPSPQFLPPTRSRALHRHGHGSQPAMAIHRTAWLEASEKVLTEIRWTHCEDGIARPVFKHSSTGRYCCAARCEVETCAYGHPPCQKQLVMPWSRDFHAPHRCSKCKQHGF